MNLEKCAKKLGVDIKYDYIRGEEKNPYIRVWIQNHPIYYKNDLMNIRDVAFSVSIKQFYRIVSKMKQEIN